MRFITVNSYDELSRKAAAIIAAQIVAKPNCVLGLATGSSPVGTYKQLIEWYKKGGVLENPTAFGINGNNLMVGGEAGAEAVAPIDVLQGYVANAVASQNAGLITVLEQILNAILMMDENMGGSLRDALEGTSLKINNREFGRLVRTVV